MKSQLHIDKKGTKRWRLPNGLFHREDGPAIEYSDGYKAWWLNGKKHREDGPAIEWNGKKEWFLNDKLYSKQEYKHKMRLIKLEHIL